MALLRPHSCFSINANYSLLQSWLRCTSILSLLKIIWIFFFHNVQKPILFHCNLAPHCTDTSYLRSWPWPCFTARKITALRASGPPPRSCPASFEERLGIRGGGGQSVPTPPRNATAPQAPHSGPPSGTTCLKKARAGCVLARTSSWLTNTGQPALFSIWTPRHRISSRCHFSWEKPGGPRGRMTTNETLLPPWQAKQAAKG